MQAGLKKKFKKRARRRAKNSLSISQRNEEEKMGVRLGKPMEGGGSTNRTKKQKNSINEGHNVWG